MIKKKTPPTEEAARLKMADLCARSEQCRYDISQKLYRLGVSPSVRESILDFLTEKKFLDDNRFARSYALDKCRFSCWGPFKIRQGLKLKRVDEDDIEDGIDSVEEKEWEEALEKSWRQKVRQLDLIGVNGKENRIKLVRFLLSRGFVYDDVKSAVYKAVKEQKENRGDE